MSNIITYYNLITSCVILILELYVAVIFFQVSFLHFHEVLSVVLFSIIEA